MNQEKLVSVIIPTFKRADSLKRAVDSVLNQKYQNIELIVVDDNDSNSEDRVKTEKIMKKYQKNKNIKYIKHEYNKNGAAARNTGIQNSLGEYVSFLDDDDEFHKEKILLQVNCLEKLSEDWGGCYTKFIRKKGNKIIDRGIESREGHLGVEILKGNFYISSGSNMLLRKSLIDDLGGFNEQFERKQDLEFLIRVCEKSKIAHVDSICLTINKDDTSNHLGEEKLTSNINYFLENFSEYIEKQDLNQKEKILKAQYLELFRYQLTRRNFKKAYSISRKSDLNVVLLLRFFSYLIKRKLMKQCYGFKL